MDAVSGEYAGMDYSRLIGRARFASTAILIAIGLFIATLIGELGEIVGVIDMLAYELDTVAVVYAVVLLAGSAAFFLSVIAVCMWIYRAHASLREAGREDLEFTPGWAVGWYFIPFANLVMPFKAMRELWSESHMTADNYGGDTPGNLGLWWGCWIIGNIVTNISTRMALTEDVDVYQASVMVSAVGSALTIASAFLLYRIVQDVTAALIANLGSVSVFE